ncbi:hypothetical protein [Rickettsia endosymbiont of Culicoides newsteadi]|nr:hypothetical protein [Rickettsia endosymbiont of Culicoides newsteadi]
MGSRSDGVHKRQFKKTIIEKPSLRGNRKVNEAIGSVRQTVSS